MYKGNSALRAVAGCGVVVLTVTACANGAGGDEGADDYPSGPVEVIVPFEAGGGTDLGARQLLPLVEDELDADIQVINRPGAGGWVGWEELVGSSSDGYTLSYMNFPNVITGYLNPDMGRDETVDDFTLIANHVTDPVTISIRNDEDRFTDFEEIVEYAQENTISANSQGVASNAHLVLMELNEELDTNFEVVQTQGASEANAQFQGGHIDLLVNTVGEVANYHNQGEFEAVVIFDEERSEYIDDVMTVEEYGFDPIYQTSRRGIGAPADLPEDIREKLAEAFEVAMADEGHLEDMASQGLNVDYVGLDEYGSEIEEQAQELEERMDRFGWNGE